MTRVGHPDLLSLSVQGFMSSPAPVSFPAPVGGVGFPSDLAPSIIFALMYLALFPVVVYRMSNKRSFTILLINSGVFVIERIIWFCLRALQARNEGSRMSAHLTGYMQITIGTAFISMILDIFNLTRCLLVNTTYGENIVQQEHQTSRYFIHTSSQDATDIPLTSLHPEAQRDELRPRREQMIVSATGRNDMPRLRFWFRRYFETLTMLALAALGIGVVVGIEYTSEALTSQSVANTVFALRWASTVIALCLTIVLLCTAAWARARLRFVRHDAIAHLMILSVFICVICIYRLSVLWKKTTSLTASGPGTFNTPGQKAAFYIFHVLPEWLTTAWLFAMNAKEIFGTGLLGDYKPWDNKSRNRQRIPDDEVITTAS